MCRAVNVLPVGESFASRHSNPEIYPARRIASGATDLPSYQPLPITNMVYMYIHLDDLIFTSFYQFLVFEIYNTPDL
jgi:hypothetical protein